MPSKPEWQKPTWRTSGPGESCSTCSMQQARRLTACRKLLLYALAGHRLYGPRATPATRLVDGISSRCTGGLRPVQCNRVTFISQPGLVQCHNAEALQEMQRPGPPQLLWPCSGMALSGPDDDTCSSQFSLVSALFHMCNHCSYLGLPLGSTVLSQTMMWRNAVWRTFAV